MEIDAFLIFVLILAGFWRYRVERQAAIEDERARRDMGMFGRSNS